MANGVIAQLWMSYEVPVESVGELGRYLITGSTGAIDFNAYGDVRVDRGDGQGWVTEWQTPPFQYLADPFTVNRVKGFADQFQDFLDAIAEGRQPAVTGADGRAAIAMVEAAERSSQTRPGRTDLERSVRRPGDRTANGLSASRRRPPRRGCATPFSAALRRPTSATVAVRAASSVAAETRISPPPACGADPGRDVDARPDVVEARPLRLRPVDTDPDGRREALGLPVLREPSLDRNRRLDGLVRSRTPGRTRPRSS